jgi:hypothetical protein
MTTIAQPAIPPLVPARGGQETDPVYRQIRDLVYKVSGIYKAEEKLYLLTDGCGRRMKQLGVRTPRDYWDQLTSQPGRDGELRQLLNEITIGETCLFRSQPQLDALRKVILPEIVAEKTKQITKRLRIWSAGCSTGEESYTLAMNMLEESERLLKAGRLRFSLPTSTTVPSKPPRLVSMATMRCARPRTISSVSIFRPSMTRNCRYARR